MRLLRVALVVLPVLLGLALLAAWVVPPFLDWGHYRGTIAQLATTRLGLPVTIKGAVTLRLLPEPVLTAGAVSVGDPAQDGMLIRVRALRLRLGLWPLLAGRIDARALELRGPDLHIPWPAPPDMLRAGPPVWLTAFAARVENGRMSIGQFAVTGINGTLSSLQTNALTADVTADIAGQRWRIAARLGNAGLDGASIVTVRMRGEGRAAGTTASFTGRLAPSGTLAGTVTAAGPNLSLLLPTPALRFQAHGRLTVADGLAEADELKVQLDGLPTDAAVALRVLPRPRLDIALSAALLNLDPWVPLLVRQPAAQLQFPVGLDVSADAASLAGATLPHLRATFTLLPGAVLVEHAGAEVPDNATVQLAGRIDRTAGSGPAFTGTARLHAPVLRTTLHWLLPHATEALSALPAAVAQSADLQGKLVLLPGRIELSALRGSLDAEALTGSVGWKRGSPPAVAADLHLDRMPLGPWLAPGAPARLTGIVLHRLDTDLKLDVRNTSIEGTTIQGLVLHAATLGGSLNLQRLQGTVLGAQVSATGAIGADGAVHDAKLRLTTGDATALADLLPVAWRATPALWFGPVRLEITAAGPRHAVVSTIGLDMGDLHLWMQPSFNVDAGTAVGQLTVQAPNAKRLISEFGLPARLGLDGAPRWLGEGSLSLVASLGVGPGQHIRLDHAQLVAGRLRTGLDLALDLAGDQPVLTGDLTAETLPLPVRAAGPLPMAWLHGWQAKLQVKAAQVLGLGETLLRDASVTVQVQHDALSLEQLSGRLGGGALAASFSLDAAQQPPALALQAKLTGAAIDGPVLRLPIDVGGGQADLSLSLRASGYSTNALTASLSGSIQASVQNGVLSGFDMGGLRDALKQAGSDPPAAALGKPLAGGDTPFQHLVLSGQVSRGILSLEKAELTGDAGTAEATGTVALPDATADLRLVLHPALPGAPSAAVLVNGPLDAPQRTPELAGVARWRSAHGH